MLFPCSTSPSSSMAQCRCILFFRLSPSQPLTSRAALSRSRTNRGVVRGLWNTTSPIGRVLSDTRDCPTHLFLGRKIFFGLHFWTENQSHDAVSPSLQLFDMPLCPCPVDLTVWRHAPNVVDGTLVLHLQGTVSRGLDVLFTPPALEPSVQAPFRYLRAFAISLESVKKQVEVLHERDLPCAVFPQTSKKLLSSSP